MDVYTPKQRTTSVLRSPHHKCRLYAVERLGQPKVSVGSSSTEVDDRLAVQRVGGVYPRFVRYLGTRVPIREITAVLVVPQPNVVESAGRVGNEGIKSRRIEVRRRILRRRAIVFRLDRCRRNDIAILHHKSERGISGLADLQSAAAGLAQGRIAHKPAHAHGRA